MEETKEKIPLLQDVYDDIWLLFFLSGVILLVGYGIWGLIDILRLPTM